MADLMNQTENKQRPPHPAGHADCVPCDSSIGLGMVGAKDQTKGNAASMQREAEQLNSGFAADSLPGQIANSMLVAQ